MDHPTDGARAKGLWRQRLRPLRLEHGAQAQAAILDHARRELIGPLPPGRRLGLYWPLAGEIDLRSLAEPAAESPGAASPARAGTPLWALPAVAGRAGQGRLEYRAWQPGEPLAPDACGIAAPEGAALLPEALGLLLVPALAVDRQGIRLGYGGGWYDRLRSDPAWRSVPSLVVVPAGCVVDGLPCDPWDVPFDGWLDEGGVHWLAAAGTVPGAPAPPT